MKPLKKLKNHFRVFEKVLSGSPQQSAAFLRKYKNGKLLYVPDAHYCYYLEDEVAIILAQNYNDENFERALMFFESRCPTWPEMVSLKRFLWHSNEVCFQVHPKKEDYVNYMKTTLHIWRPKKVEDIQVLDNASKLVRKALRTVDCLSIPYFPYFIEKTIKGKRFIAIFCEKNWATWEEVCDIKQKTFGDEHTAIQFNISNQIDLNSKKILILWDAEELGINLPPKNLV